MFVHLNKQTAIGLFVKLQIMKRDTLVYSQYIKHNNIVCVGHVFTDLNKKVHTITKDNQGWWVDDQEGPFLSKKSAIYFTCKN